MIKCADCENAIFCESWGEYKCAVKEMHMRDIIMCDQYKKGKDVPKKCRCETCQEREGDEE